MQVGARVVETLTAVHKSYASEPGRAGAARPAATLALSENVEGVYLRDDAVSHRLMSSTRVRGGAPPRRKRLRAGRATRDAASETRRLRETDSSDRDEEASSEDPDDSNSSTTDDDEELDTTKRRPKEGGGRAPLRVLALNVAGLNDATKRRACFTFLRQQQVDVCLLSETHLASARSREFWERGWARGKKKASWWAISATPHSGGTAVLIRPDLPLEEVSVLLDEESGRGSWVRVSGTLAGVRWHWQAVYVPASPTLRLAMLKSPASWCPPCPAAERELIGGDFNCVEDLTNDTVNRPTYSNAGGGELASLTAARGWADAWRVAKRAPASSGMTLWRGTAGSRIDRVYVSEASQSAVRSVVTVPWVLSDHLAVKVVLEEAGATVRSYSKCFTANRDLVDSAWGIEEVAGAIQQAMAARCDGESAGERWVRVKDVIRATLRSLAQARAEARKRVHTADSRELEGLAAAHPLDEEQQARYTSLRSALAKQASEAAQGAALRCRCKWLADGERCSGYFLRLEKARRAPPGELKVRDEQGRVVDSRTKVAREVRRVWGKIFSEPSQSEDTTERAAVRTFLDCWPKQLSAQSRATAHAPISLQEAEEQLQRMRVAAAPGPDGLPISVLQHHWTALGPLWVEMVAEAEQTKRLPQAVTEGQLVLIPKGSEGIRSAAQNRPITLLNGDYKLLTSILAARLNRVVDEVVLELQTGFIAGRFIGDNVILIRDYLHWLRSRGEDKAVLFLDFEKAYDRVRWRWLWRVLDKVGLGGRFSDWVRACYSDPKVRVMMEGMSLGWLSPSRGVRQGCPLSPLLFALCIEPLHYRLTVDRRIRGVKLPCRTDGRQLPRLRATLFADDVTLFPDDEQDAHAMLHIVEIFGGASGSLLNRGKSVAVLSLWRAPLSHYGGLRVLQPGDKVKSLGMEYGPGLQPTQQWEQIMRAMRERVRAWGRRDGLSIFGRVVIANTLVTSMITYHAAFLRPSDAQLVEMDKLVWAAVWHRDPSSDDFRGGWLSKEACQLPVAEGGLNLLLPSEVVRSRQAAMVTRALAMPRAVWTVFLQDSLSTWGGVWLEGWDALWRPTPRELRQHPWGPAIEAWRAMQWRFAESSSPWSILATPLWFNPALPAVDRLRHRKAAAVLAQGGVRRIRDLWDAGQRRWRTDDEVLGELSPNEDRGGASVVLGRVRAALQEAMPTELECLLEPLPPPQVGTWWLDHGVAGPGLFGGAVQRGGQVVETSDCMHADPGFGGFDLVIAVAPEREWAVGLADRRGGVISTNRERVCGFNGAPLAVGSLERPGTRVPKVMHLETETRTQPQLLVSSLGGGEWAGTAGGRTMRMAKRMARGLARPPATRPQEYWRAVSEQVEPQRVRQHFVRASLTVGLPKKARQLIIKTWWRRALPTGIPGANKECTWCEESFKGQAERHVFFDCYRARQLWDFLRARLAARGFRTNEDTSLLLIQGAEQWDRVGSDGNGARMWRTLWSCYVWALWRTYWDTVHARIARRNVAGQLLAYGWDTLAAVLTVAGARRSGGDDAVRGLTGGPLSVWASLGLNPRSNRRGRTSVEQAGGWTLQAAGGDDPT